MSLTYFNLLLTFEKLKLKQNIFKTILIHAIFEKSNQNL